MPQPRPTCPMSHAGAPTAFSTRSQTAVARGNSWSPQGWLARREGVNELGSLVTTGPLLAPSLLATVILVVLVQPLKDRLQRAVSRMLYGSRDERVPRAVPTRSSARNHRCGRIQQQLAALDERIT